MRDTPYSKTCSKTSRKFFDDFDLLPSEIKHMLDYGPTCPDFDDLRAAWELLQESGTVQNIINRIRCLPKLEKPKSTRYQRRLEAKSKRAQATQQERPVLAGNSPRSDKHARLVLRVTQEQAAALLNRRQETRDIEPARYCYEWVPRVDPFKRAKLRNARKGDKLLPEKVIRDSIAKSMHNAGGKK